MSAGRAGERPDVVPDDDTPPGWSLNPSTWGQRLPLVAVALAGVAVAVYLALYQWRIVDRVWEPFFGDGSARILDSWVSVRWLEALAGVALVAAPWAFGYEVFAAVNSVVCGVVLALAGSRAGPRTLRFGGGWKALLGAPRNI